MKPHDPYGPLLTELRAANDAGEDEIFFESLRQLQPYVTQLRLQYKQCPSNVDFSCPHTRAAYLLAYYPHYIEPVYWALSQLKDPVLVAALNQPTLRVCCVGAGPAPEALGLALYLQEHCPQTTCVTAYLLDKYVDGWHLGQELTRYHLAPHYWPAGKLVFKPLEFDFLDETCLDEPFINRAIRHAQLFIMQNCLNDQLANPQAAREMVLRLFRLAQPGALFLICDLNFDPVCKLICSLEKAICAEQIGQVILPVQRHVTVIRSQITTPVIVKEHLLTGDEAKRLIARRTTDYYYAIFQRITEEIPF